MKEINEHIYIDKSVLMENISIRARIAFYLIIVEKAIQNLPKDSIGYANARETLDKCWDVCEGINLSGDELCYYLENEEGTGLMVFSSEVMDDTILEPIWLTIITATMYAIWQTYKINNDPYLPESIEQVDENAIDYLIESAIKCEGISIEFIEDLKNRFISKYKVNDMDEIGEAIEKNYIIKSII